MLQEFLWENTQVYREIKELGEEQGEARGIKLGKARGIELGKARGTLQPHLFGNSLPEGSFEG